jgi:hypothetical protein
MEGDMGRGFLAMPLDWRAYRKLFFHALTVDGRHSRLYVRYFILAHSEKTSLPYKADISLMGSRTTHMPGYVSRITQRSQARAE